MECEVVEQCFHCNSYFVFEITVKMMKGKKNMGGVHVHALLDEVKLHLLKI